MKHFPEINTANYRLRQFTTDDLESVFVGLSDARVIKYYGISFETIEATKAQMAWYNQLFEAETGIWWAIVDSSGDFIGAVGFNGWIKQHKRAELGFWLLPDYWRRGIVSEVLPYVCRFAFDSMDLHRIHAEVETENIASKNALIKAGFVFEGTMRDCEFKDGQSISLDIYAKLKNT